MTERVGISISGREWYAWGDLELHFALDGFATASFSAPFEPERSEFREAFRPFSFRDLEVVHDGTQLFAGTLVDVAPDAGPGERRLSASGYSRPAVLGEVNAPASAFPLELNGLTLRQIAATIAAPFGLDVEVEGDDGAPFRRVAMEPDAQPLSFLADLARQRGMVVSDTRDGRLLLRRSVAPGRPVARLREGTPPLMAVSASFSPQSYFSEITGLAQARSGRGRGASYTLQNERLSGVVRPSAFKPSDTDGPDLPAAVAAKLGRMFGNMVSYSLELPTWRDPSGAIWEPNTTITIEAPGAMIYRETELLIRAVTLKQGDAETASLELVLPGAFSGEIPEALPWD